MIEEYRICPVCGKKFLAHRSTEIICSDECRKERNRQRTAESNKLRRAPEARKPNAEILEIVKDSVEYGKIVAERECKVTVDKVFEDNMDELRMER